MPLYLAHPHVNEISSQSNIPAPPTAKLIPNIAPPPQPMQTQQVLHPLQHAQQLPEQVQQQTQLEPAHSNIIDSIPTNAPQEISADVLAYVPPNQLLSQHVSILTMYLSI